MNLKLLTTSNVLHIHCSLSFGKERNRLKILKLFPGLDKWQHTISSSIDRLVAFASTELDKRRRSTEGGGGALNTSCNTSPDSGIGHGDPPPAPLTVLAKMPRLYRPSPGRDSPPVLEPGPPRTPSPSSPPPLLPLDGPYSPVPPTSPPPLAPSVPLRYQRNEQHFKKKFFQHKGKFRPKGKGWDWHHATEAEPWC